MEIIDPVITTDKYRAKVWKLVRKGTRKKLVMTIEVITGSKFRAIELVRDYLQENGIEYDKFEVEPTGEVRE